MRTQTMKYKVIDQNGYTSFVGSKSKCERFAIRMKAINECMYTVLPYATQLEMEVTS